ncbi:MAG: hypothetical protein ABID38_02550 [Candidatus Diapherotrites archaeon]
MLNLNSLLKQTLKVALFLGAGVLLIALSILSFIQGLLWQLEANFVQAFLDYFVAILCIAIDYWIFMRAKEAFRIAEYSELHA